MKNVDLTKIVQLAQSAEEITKIKDELLPVFDENENLIGEISRYLCHRLGLLHKVVYLFVENEKGKLLIQTRGDTQNGRLDVPVGGHFCVNDNDEIQALIRETREEIGLELEAKMLKFIFSYKRKSYGTLQKPHEKNFEIRKVFYLNSFYDLHKDVFEIFKKREEKEMVRKLEWLSIDDILLATENNRCADGLKESMSHFLNWKINQNKL